MASNTPNLNLLKKNPATDGNETFNVQTMLNENWDKIDAVVGELEETVGGISIPVATTTVAGIVRLTEAVDSNSSVLAPTANALKKVNDRVSTQLAEAVKLSLSVVPPSVPTANTWWYEDMGESIDMGGGGIIISNGSMNGEKDIWFAVMN